jgi:hypothetical protein
VARKLFLYKNNVSMGEAQTAWGDWYRFFEEKQPSRWGGEWTTNSHLSLKILREEMNVDDLVLCWQTDLQGAVGLCRVADLRDRSKGREIWLEALESAWDEPVRFTDLKRVNPILRDASALQPGGGTLFRTTHQEAVEILKACDLDVELLRGGNARNSRRQQNTAKQPRGGGGLGKPDENKIVEEAAVEIFKRIYAGWLLDDKQDDKVGYDFIARKGRSERHVEVKGAKGTRRQQFPITVNEIACARTDAKWRVCVVDGVFAEAPTYEEFTGAKFLEEFNLKELSYMATRK